MPCSEEVDDLEKNFISLISTKKYSVFSTCGGNLVAKVNVRKGLPSLRISEFNWQNAILFRKLMERHSFLILVDDTGVCGDDFKSTCRGDLYFNERGIPMWNSGYEKCGNVREAFRIHVDDVPTEEKSVWQTNNFRKIYLHMQTLCRKICDQALSLVLGFRVSNSEGEWGKDFSVCYTLNYPNNVNDGTQEFNVTEHVDPSLFVTEPCCGVSGLEIQDHFSRDWIEIEAVCRRGIDIVLFGGKALEEATNGSIKGALHRVRKGRSRRQCFIFEQKYENFYSSPLD